MIERATAPPARDSAIWQLSRASGNASHSGAADRNPRGELVVEDALAKSGMKVQRKPYRRADQPDRE
jgi:hypothetical protein